MPELSTIKRRPLHSAVQENLNLIQRRLPRSRQRARLTGFAWEYRALVSLLAPSLLVISSGIFAVTGNARWTAFFPPEPARLPTAPVSRVALLPRPALAPTASEPLTTPTEATLAAFPLTVRKVVLNPGHGGNDLGTVAARGPTEKDLTLDIASRLRQLLEETTVTVFARS